MTDLGGTLTPQQIRTALERVAAILSERGVTARIDVFGGASLALVHAPTRTATADVDGSYVPVGEIELAADEVANELGLRAFGQIEIVNSDPSYTLPAIVRSDQ